MSQFDERQRSFENKFAHDEELQFRAGARRNKLLGQWAAGLMGKTGDEVAAYAKAVVIANMAASGEEVVFAKVFGDLQAAKAGVDEPTLRAKMDALRAEAKAQIMTEVKD